MQKILIYFILLMALVLVSIVGVVSVTGLMKIFAGAGTLGLILFITIESTKVIGTSTIHTYRHMLEWPYKVVIIIGIVIAMAITSLGVYGFLSNSYKIASDAMTISNNKIDLINIKKNTSIDAITSLNHQISTKRDRINGLIEIRTQQENRLDSLYSKRLVSSAKRTEKIIEGANADIKTAEIDINSLTQKISIFNDSINSYETQIIELKQKDNSLSDLNSLKYLSDITGRSMDWVMKWFILLLIIIGDPMAVLFVIVFNKVVNYNASPINSSVVDIQNKQTETNFTSPTIREMRDVIPMRKSTQPIETESIKKPIVSKGQISKEDINDIRDKNRSSSGATNVEISRIGANKEIRDGNTDKVYFKRRNDNQQ